jgi:subtilase family serine protease
MARGLDVFRYPLPDLAAPSSNITASWQPRGGWNLSALVINAGDRAASNVVVRFQEGTRTIGTRTIPSLAAGGRQTVSVAWYAPSLHGRTVTVTVDPADTVTELNESNNVSRRSWSSRQGLSTSALALL